MIRQRTGRAAALLGIAAILAACTNSVTGAPVAAGGHTPQPSSSATKPARPKVSARDLLLREAEPTPYGPAAPGAVGDTFFTSVRPPECAAAVLFKDSPLRPPGSSDHAESAYIFSRTEIYAESADVYDKDLNSHDVVWNGFAAVAKCNADAVGLAPAGQAPAMKLREFAVPADGVLAWVMAGDQETCAYGLVVIPDAALVLVACDTEGGRVNMMEWAPKRREQIMSRTA
ncbi:MAG: hypothetical protein WB785_12255 [Mycobacterium sp.]|uniref:hypothetical protein n=1 Tax=Mycobacterium sp. TaxID=1785 RepID=UPI003C440C91